MAWLPNDSTHCGWPVAQAPPHTGSQPTQRAHKSALAASWQREWVHTCHRSPCFTTHAARRGGHAAGKHKRGPTASSIDRVTGCDKTARQRQWRNPPQRQPTGLAPAAAARLSGRKQTARLGAGWRSLSTRCEHSVAQTNATGRQLDDSEVPVGAGCLVSSAGRTTQQAAHQQHFLFFSAAEKKPPC